MAARPAARRNIDGGDGIISKNKELGAVGALSQGRFQADDRDRAAIAGEIEDFVVLFHGGEG